MNPDVYDFPYSKSQQDGAKNTAPAAQIIAVRIGITRSTPMLFVYINI